MRGPVWPVLLIQVLNRFLVERATKSAEIRETCLQLRLLDKTTNALCFSWRAGKAKGEPLVKYSDNNVYISLLRGGGHAQSKILDFRKG